VAVAGAIALMHATGTLHPPGGATALIAVTGGPKLLALGYLYALIPVLSGALVMLAVALVAVNAVPSRRYPLYWW
jgi:CBS-domain-containing membrane protein